MGLFCSETHDFLKFCYSRNPRATNALQDCLAGLRTGCIVDYGRIATPRRRSFRPKPLPPFLVIHENRNNAVPFGVDTNISNVSFLVRELLTFIGIACQIMNWAILIDFPSDVYHYDDVAEIKRGLALLRDSEMPEGPLFYFLFSFWVFFFPVFFIVFIETPRLRNQKKEKNWIWIFRLGLFWNSGHGRVLELSKVTVSSTRYSVRMYY